MLVRARDPDIHTGPKAETKKLPSDWRWPDLKKRPETMLCYTRQMPSSVSPPPKDWISDLPQLKPRVLAVMWCGSRGPVYT